MFQTVRKDGSAITLEDALERARFETLVEIMQHKGESECMLGKGTEDELCTFENLAMSSFSGRFLRSGLLMGGCPGAITPAFPAEAPPPISPRSSRRTSTPRRTR